MEYGVYGDLMPKFPKAIFYLLKGDYNEVHGASAASTGLGSAPNSDPVVPPPEGNTGCTYMQSVVCL